MENSQNNEMRDNLILGGAIAGLGFGLYKIYQNWRAGGLSDIAPGNVAQRKAVMARLRESGEMTWTPPEKSKSGTPARPKQRKSKASTTAKKGSTTTAKKGSTTRKKASTTAKKGSTTKKTIPTVKPSTRKKQEAKATTRKVSNETQKGMEKILAKIDSF